MAGHCTMRTLRILLPAALTLTALAGIALAGDTGAGTSRSGALRLEIRGAIGPATSNYVLKGLRKAAEGHYQLALIEMDTPGGLDSAMRDIIKGILASEVPVVTYVSPRGSRAASAGTYILYASHVAAMAPATNLGAATPVQIGGGEKPEAAKGSGSTLERKSVNDAVAYIRGLASLRGRNADWAERAVREAASLAAEQAVQQHVVDLISPDIPSLLGALDGRMLQVADGEVRIASAGMAVDAYRPDWRTRLLAAITDPNIAYFLLLVGIYGLLFEGYNPGVMFPGVIGAISLLLAVFAFQLLPVNFAGLALILLGVVLLVAEAFVPSFGSLGIGGIAAFVFGSIILIDSDVPGFSISRTLIGGVALTAALALLGMMTLLVRIRRRPVVSGREELLGSVAEALEDFDHHGAVFVHGERWNARSHQPVRKGQRVRVIALHGLLLDVEPAPDEQF